MTTLITKNEGSGDGSAVPLTLEKGELAVNTQSFVLYVGDAAGLATPIGGGGGSLNPGGSDGQTLRWEASGDVWVPTSALLVEDDGTITVGGDLAVTGTIESTAGFQGDLVGNAETATTATNATNADHADNCNRGVTAGAGLTGGGILDETITLDVGEGSGIDVSTTTVAVDSTVVRTTGNQTLSGTKTFGSNILTTGINVTGGSTLGIVQSALGGATKYIKCNSSGGFFSSVSVTAEDVEMPSGEMLTDTITALKAQIIALGGTI